MDWTNLEPSNFREGFLEKRQLAKDEKYLEAVLKLWQAEERGIPTETSPLVYCDGNENNLYGHIIRRGNQQDDDDNKVPGILLFHTGAGPQDVFLFYKADVLAQTFNCVVMICDILSDESGWAWGPDRTHYNRMRESLIADHGYLLESRVLAAGQALCENAPEVDPQRVAAMGWCLGGQPILEMGRLRSSKISIKAMSTFHGVFRRDEPISRQQDASATSDADTDKDSQQLSQNAEILICNGADDPFVTQEDLDMAKKSFLEKGHKVEILQLAGAKHGFTNPAQAFSDNPAFDYDEVAANKAWTETIKLFQRTLG
jgi:dienelactone hydrolase